MNDTEFERESVNDIETTPARTPAQRRLQEDASATNEDLPVYLTDDGYPTSLDHAPDVTDAGLLSNGSVDGLDADLDSMPGDETPISS